MTTFRACLFLFAAAMAPAAAETTPVDPAQREELSLQGFGAKNATCVEWSDSCATCRRDSDGAAHCSTPGIACLPVEITCKTP
jgi:hypothetical protein